MMNFLQNLRLKNLFDPEQMGMGMGNPPPTPMPNPTMPGSYNPMPDPNPTMNRTTIGEGADDIDIQALMSQLYTPETQASDRFNKLIENRPQQNQNPSFLRKLGAALAGTASNAFGSGKGQDVFDNIVNPGYKRNLAEWEALIGPSQQAATLERGTNTNERMMANQTVQQMLSDRKASETNRSNVERERLAGEREDKRLADAEKLRIQQSGRTDLATSAQTAATERQTQAQIDALARIAAQGQNQIAGIDARAAAKDKQGNNPQDLGFLQNEAREALTLINELYDSKEDKLSDLARTSTGKSAAFGYIPTTTAYTGKQKIKSLKDKLTLSIIQGMKQSSKTGATGFGQLNLRELGVLEGAASILDPFLSEDAFKFELKKIKERLEKMLQPADNMGETKTKTPFDPAAYYAELMKKKVVK